MLCSLHIAQNCLHSTITFVCSKTTPCSAPSGYSKTPAAHSIYGSLSQKVTYLFCDELSIDSKSL